MSSACNVNPTRRTFCTVVAKKIPAPAANENNKDSFSLEEEEEVRTVRRCPRTLTRAKEPSEDGSEDGEVKEKDENEGKNEPMEADATRWIYFNRIADNQKQEASKRESKRQNQTAGGGDLHSRFDEEPPGELLPVHPKWRRPAKTFATTLKFTIFYQGTVRPYSIYAESVHTKDAEKLAAQGRQDPNKDYEHHSEYLIIYHLINLVKHYSSAIHMGPSSDPTGDTSKRAPPVVSFLSWEEHPVRSKITSERIDRKNVLCPGCFGDYTKLLSILDSRGALQPGRSKDFQLQQNTLPFSGGLQSYTSHREREEEKQRAKNLRPDASRRSRKLRR